MFILIIISFYY